MLPQAPVAEEGVTTRAGVADYCAIFNDEMYSLYLLAFLLTADKDKAEECYVGGLGECVERIGEWVGNPRTWARYAIVRHAIEMIRPTSGRFVSGMFVSNGPASSATRGLFEDIVMLGAFERFVFVMSVLEGQPDEDCQSLLGCSRQEVVMARKAALRFIAAANPGCGSDQKALCDWPRLVN